MESFSWWAAWLPWFLAGVALAFLELALPGLILIFFGMGCLVTAALLIFFDLSLTSQVWVFILSSLISLFSLRSFMMRVFRGRTTEEDVASYDDFPGDEIVDVVKDIAPGSNGKVRYRGTNWEAASDEIIPAGERARIVRWADNAHLIYFVKQS